jgi:hypothetical protein
MLQASFQKIDLQGLAAYLALQLGYPVLLGPPLAVALKRFGPVVPQFALPAMEHVGVHLTDTGDLTDRGAQFHPPHGGFLELFGVRSSRQSHSSFLHSMKIEP